MSTESEEAGIKRTRKDEVWMKKGKEGEDNKDMRVGEGWDERKRII